MSKTEKPNFLLRSKILITRVGDEGPAYFRRDIIKLSDEFINHFAAEQPENKENILRHFVEAIGLLNQKGGIYATAVTLIDLKLPNFAETIIDRVLENLQRGLDCGDLIIPQYSLIFLGELMNIGLVNSFSFITLLYDLVNEAEKTLKNSFDYYLQIVISISPYLIDGLSEKSGLEFKSLIDNIQEIMKKREKSRLSLLRHFSNKDHEDFLTILWNNLFDLINKGGEKCSRVIHKPYSEFKEEFKNVKQIKKNKKIYFNNKNQKSCVFFSPEKINFLEDEGFIPNGPTQLEKLLIFGHLTELFHLFAQENKILQQRLMHYHSSFNYTSILVEVLFSEILRLPQASSQLIALASLAVSLANEPKIEFRNEFRNHFFQAFDNLLRKIDSLDVELIERLAKVFSIYLANNKVSWEWKKWDFIREEDLMSPKRVFLNICLQQLCFFIGKQVIKDELPEELQEFLPPEKLYKSKFNEPSSSNYADAEIIMDKLNLKISEPELTDFISNTSTNNLEATGDFFIEIFMECFLVKTSQSLTHLKVILERYKNFLNSFLGASESSQTVALNSIQEFWAFSQWHVQIYVQTFLEQKLIKPHVVINWVFKNLEGTYTKLCEEHNLWKFLGNLIERGITKVDGLKQDIKRNSGNPSEIENAIKALKDENKTNLLLILKKACASVIEFSQNQKGKVETAGQRLLGLIRNYGKEIEGLYEKLEEDLILLGNVPEMQRITPYFKILI